MSNEVLLACVTFLIGAAGALARMVWAAQERKTDDAEKVSAALEVRLRKLETEGGEPVRMLREEIRKLDAKLDDLTDSIRALTHELSAQRIAVAERTFGKPSTNPGG